MNFQHTITHVSILTVAFFTTTDSKAQGDVPADAKVVVSMPLEAAQAKLTDSGYEIAHSSLMGKEQYWWQESSKSCVCIKFSKGDGKPVKEVTRIANGECEKGIAAAREVAAAYSDGAAPVHSAKLDAERKKLSDKGLTVSYWAKELCKCGNSIEYWSNTAGDKCGYVVFKTDSGEWVNSDSCEPKQGKNPYPKKP